MNLRLAPIAAAFRWLIDTLLQRKRQRVQQQRLDRQDREACRQQANWAFVPSAYGGALSISAERGVLRLGGDLENVGIAEAPAECPGVPR